MVLKISMLTFSYSENLFSWNVIKAWRLWSFFLRGLSPLRNEGTVCFGGSGPFFSYLGIIKLFQQRRVYIFSFVVIVCWQQEAVRTCIRTRDHIPVKLNLQKSGVWPQGCQCLLQLPYEWPGTCRAIWSQGDPWGTDKSLRFAYLMSVNWQLCV